ncbi:MAG TPA: DUF1080 domain-containing protein [Rhizomicrobium sp.]|nr:DUF1080 domain-containing protein [Rhizomicrobium sp.]
MKYRIALTAVLGIASASGFVLPAMTQDAAVDPAELQRLMKEHPAWAVWLSDPKLARLTLAGPKMPGSQYRVNDIRRPQPRRVNTGSACAAKPPSGAEVLFDGHDLSKWTGDHFAEWTVRDGAVTTGARVYNFLKTKESFGDAQIHVEFKEPRQPHPPANPQYRGNSGVFLMGLYEVQILDNYKSQTYPDGMLGSIYSQFPPLANAARPAGMWQCYDITFRAPHFSGGTMTVPARVTVKLNGVLVQHNVALIGATVHGKVGVYAPHAAELPLALQDHGNPDSHVSFRNIWIKRLPPS